MTAYVTLFLLFTNSNRRKTIYCLSKPKLYTFVLLIPVYIAIYNVSKGKKKKTNKKKLLDYKV